MVPHEDFEGDLPPDAPREPAVSPPPLGEVNEKVVSGRTNFDAKYHVSHRWSDQMSAKVRTAGFFVGRTYVNDNKQVCRSSPEE